MDEDYYGDGTAVHESWRTGAFTAVALAVGFIIGCKFIVSEKGSVGPDAEVRVDVGVQTEPQQQQEQQQQQQQQQQAPVQAAPPAVTVPSGTTSSSRAAPTQPAPAAAPGRAWYRTNSGAKWHATPACRYLKDISNHDIITAIVVPLVGEECKSCAGHRY